MLESSGNIYKLPKHSRIIQKYDIVENKVIENYRILTNFQGYSQMFQGIRIYLKNTKIRKIESFISDRKFLMNLVAINIYYSTQGLFYFRDSITFLRTLIAS